MKNLIISIKKLIPAYFEIRSLYWVQYEKAMNEELKSIFEKIDIDDYSAAENLIKMILFKSSNSISNVFTINIINF